MDYAKFTYHRRIWDDHIVDDSSHQQDYPIGKFTLVFVGYGLETEEPTLQDLTYSGIVGTAFSQIAIEVKTCTRLVNKSGPKVVSLSVSQVPCRAVIPS